MFTFLIIYVVVATALISVALGGLLWAASQDGQRQKPAERGC
jgi:nitrogen fixation-related uncharacterized protein